LEQDVLRIVTAQDQDCILDLNKEHAVETSSLDLSAAEHLLAICFYAKGIGLGARGFLLAPESHS
jgi:predicted GNAT superfamily acetyltransferase